jgi:hypothetical protein
MTQPKLRTLLVVLFVAAAASSPTGLALARADARSDDAEKVQEARPPDATQAEAPEVLHQQSAPQVPRGTRPGDVQKVFVLQHVRPGYLTRLLRVFPAEISSVEPREGGLSALAVSAKPAVVAAIEETIRRLDQPGTDSPRAGSNVELTGYVLEGSMAPEPSETLPSDLERVVAQLHRTFKYSTYRMLDTVVARARGDGSGFSVNGVTEKRLFPLGPSYYRLRAVRTHVAGGDPRVVRLTSFAFSLEIPIPTGPPPSDNSQPVPFQYKSIGLESDIDVRDGHYVVVGKSGLGGSENALVLVLTAKVVD